MSIFQLMACSKQRPIIAHQFVLSPDQIVNVSGCGYATRVADEQLLPNPETIWEPHEKKYCTFYTPSLGISLNREVQVAKIHVLSKTPNPYMLSIFLGKQKIAQSKGTLEKGWNEIVLSQNMDLFRFDFEGETILAEILVESAKEYPIVRAKPTLREPVLMQDFIGTNAFVDVPIGLLEPFGSIREYHDWPWNEPDQDSIKLDVTSNGFDFKNFYTNLHSLGKEVIPCLQKNPKWLNSIEQGKPTKELGNLELPSAYKRHSLFMSLYAQHFSKKENGGIRYYENWNEHDKWWEGENSYFPPYQYAAMSSADADGHNGTMGNYGLKGQQKEGKLVMSGLANIKLDYVHALKYWCDQHRNGNFAWDVINFHQYSNSAKLVDDQPLEGISPESAHIYEKTKEITAFRDKYLPQVEVWNSEFGFDTEKSPQQAPAIGTKNSDMVQADWLVRSYLLLSATGIEKAFQFMIRDAGTEGYYATSGLYSSTLMAKPYRKAAWYYVATLKNLLYDSYFKQLSVDTSNQIYTIVYENKIDSLLKTMVIWHGTHEGKVTKNYRIPTSVRNTVRLTEFSAGSPCGNSHVLTETKADITETPIVLQEHPNGQFPPCRELKVVDWKNIQCKDQNGTPDPSLLDEHLIDNNPLMGEETLVPKTLWVGGYAQGKVEAREFDLGEEKNLHSLCVFDAGGMGDVEVFAKEKEEWKWVGSFNLNLYNKWKSCGLNVKTRYIKMVRSSGWADMGEVLFYENKIN